MTDQEVKPEHKPRERTNVVYIGEKPLMNYVTSIVLNFTAQNMPEVIIKSRGKFISKAVDITEVARNRFLSDQVELKDIKIGSEDFINKENRKIRVSFIEITLKKKI